MPTAVISTLTDLATLLPITNGTITIGPNTIPGSLLSDILNTFNGGQSLQITTQTPAAILNNGVTLSGTAPFLGSSSVQLSGTFQVNGDFVLTATVQHLLLSQLTSYIKDITLPNGMSRVDLGTVQVIATQTGGALTFSAASNSNIGEFAFKAQKSTKWGAAFGFEVNTGGIAALPGLRNTALARFDSFVGLSNLLMVLSTFDAPAFDFPDVVSFNGSSFTGVGKITLPGSGGLKTGLNIFASIATQGSSKGATAQLTKRLHLDGLSAALSISLPDPLTGSQLYFSLNNVAIQKNVILNGSFGGRLASSSVGVFFNGTVQAPIQNQQVTFAAQAIAAPTGVVLGGSMQTTTGLKFDVGSTKFNIIDLGFVIGIDDDGLPSLGLAATFDINSAEVSAAVFIDSVNPSQSVFAAAVSSFSLYDIATCIAGQKSSDLASMKSILQTFNLSGTQNFSLPGTLSTALNARNLNTIATAFQTSAAQIALPSTYDKVQVTVNTPGSKWYITDLTTQLHYSLTSSSNGTVAVQLEPQFYFAGQDTNIGALVFPKGFFVSGQIDLFLLKASVDVVVQSTGLIVEVDVDPVTLGGSNFFALTGASGAAGPRVSIATMSQPQLTDPILSQPHVLISGEVKLLGIDVSSTYFIASSSGVTFDLNIQASPWLGINLHGNVGNSAAFSLGGSVTLGLNDTFDLGALGSISLPSFTAALSMAYSNNLATAHLAINFTLASWTITFGQDLSVSTGAFTSSDGLKNLLHAPMFNALQAQVKADATQWLNAVQQGWVTASTDITSVANVLQTQFHKAPQEISNILASAKYSADQIYHQVLQVISPSNADAILRSTVGLNQDQLNSVLTYTTQAYNNATTFLSNLESSLQSAGNQVVNFFNGLVGKSTGSSNADAALDNALNSAGLSQPALSMRQFKSLARIGASGGNDTFILGVGTDNLPYLVTWMHARGHGWKGGRMLPYPPVPGFAISRLSMAVSHTGDVEVFGLGTDGTPYLVAYMGSGCYGSVIDRRQGWNPGMVLPCPSGQSKFTAMAHTLSPGGDLEVVGIGKDKKAYLISYLSTTNGWQPGIPLPCPASQNQFASIGVFHSNNNVLHVYGLGVDNLPYRIAYLDQSGWHAGEALPCPAGQSQFRNLYAVTPTGGDMWILGLGLDGLPYIVSSVGTGGNFYAGHALPVFSGAVFNSLEAAGGISNGDLQVFCLGMDNQIYLASYLPRGATSFVSANQLPHPAQMNQFRSLSFTLAGNGDGEVCGLGMDNQPYIVTYISDHGWQPGSCMNM